MNRAAKTGRTPDGRPATPARWEYLPVSNFLSNFQLQPLYYIDRTRRFPVNCVIGSPGCNSLNRDFALITGESRLNGAMAAGYRYAGIHGYVFQSQAPGTQALRVQCRTNRDDCAVFLEDQRVAFESDGYTGLMDGMADSLLGYADPTADADQDGLPDGMERAIGTSPSLADSDGDGLVDGAEYPLAGLPLSDPPTILPAQPTSDSQIQMRIRTGVCDVFTTTGPNDRMVEVIGSRVLVTAQGFSTEDFAQCIFPVGTYTYNIGRLTVGSYTLEVYQRDLFQPQQVRLVGTAPFVVQPGQSVQIPVIGSPSLALLLLLCGGVGVLALRHRI